MPMPTTSPATMLSGIRLSRVSSQISGSPNSIGVAVANTYSQRGVMTAVPNAESLGLIRWIVKGPFLGVLAAGSAHWRTCLQPQPDTQSPGCQGLKSIITQYITATTP